METKILDSFAEDVANKFNLSQEDMQFLISTYGHNWRKPEIQIPDLYVDSDGNMFQNHLNNEDYVIHMTSKGNFKTFPCFNPKTKRRLDSLPFYTKKAIDVFGKSLYYIYKKACEHNGYQMLSENQFLEELYI